ncbi:MAG TPA: DNA-formamidopyrimidine glycosylase family protein [Thermoanaerobaculia bacterium]|nr:DNA-formamidopyrimidine glycosylase family protein [Thermoanaerobaculia bacterium]
MPELPDITVYLDALSTHVAGEGLERIRLTNPFVLRTVSPAPQDLVGKRVIELGRIGKRIVLGFENDLFLVIHLMIAGRLKWLAPGAKIGGKATLAALDFPLGTLQLTEAGSKRRASLHVLKGEQELRQLDPGGIEVLETTIESFARALRSENHTIKRSLTDPRLFSGIGNAYSDEILHRAGMSPVLLTSRMSDGQVEVLYDAMRATLLEWIERLRHEAAGSFPAKVMAFRKEMAVHGKFGEPCPVCSTPVQRIVYAENETNYCARCQTAGKLLADRALSKLLKSDWPKSIDGVDV